MAINRKYVSELDNFIRELLQTNTHLKYQQHKLRQTWWDKDPIDPQATDTPDTIAHSSYAYFDYSVRNK